MFWADSLFSSYFASHCAVFNGPGVACATSRTVLGSIPSDVTWDFFRGSFRQNHVPWGRLSLWKWVPGFSPGVKAAVAFGWRPTTLVVPKVEKIQGLNLPGTPRATSACRGIPIFFTLLCSILMVKFVTSPGLRHSILGRKFKSMVSCICNCKTAGCCLVSLSSCV